MPGGMSASGGPVSPGSPAASVGVVIPTRNSRHHLLHCLPPVLASALRPKVLIVDSASTDGTVELASTYGVSIACLPQSNFNHGATREFARRQIGTDIVVMMTHDAYPDSPRFLELLVEPLRRQLAAVSYARQLPRRNARLLEAFPRLFNYPPQSELRSIEDLDRYGSHTFFCSNSCAAWSNRALDAVGGFPTTVVTEDSIAAARLLLAGHRIAYVADATVRHSHDYSLLEEFRRYFDIGYVRQLFKGVLIAKYSEERYGQRFVRALLLEILRHQPALLPYAVLQIGAKYAGYLAGRIGPRLPRSVCRALSGQPYYWDSVHASAERGERVQ